MVFRLVHVHVDQGENLLIRQMSDAGPSDVAIVAEASKHDDLSHKVGPRKIKPQHPFQMVTMRNVVSEAIGAEDGDGE